MIFQFSCDNMGIKMIRKQRKLRQITEKMGLYNEQEMIRIHEYERLRTDRNGMKFSHISVKIDFNVVPTRQLHSFIANLIRQLRMTDHIGWERTDSIGVILPGTDEIGAHHFILNTRGLLKGLPGATIELVAIHPLPDTLLAAAVSASTPIIEKAEPIEAEEVSILPFK